MATSKLVAMLGPERPKCPQCKRPLEAIKRIKLRAWNYWWRDTLATCPHCESVLGFARS